jgi:hypothetical protein
MWKLWLVFNSTQTYFVVSESKQPPRGSHNLLYCYMESSIQGSLARECNWLFPHSPHQQVFLPYSSAKLFSTKQKNSNVHKNCNTPSHHMKHITRTTFSPCPWAWEVSLDFLWHTAGLRRNTRQTHYIIVNIVPTP